MQKFQYWNLLHLSGTLAARRPCASVISAKGTTTTATSIMRSWGEGLCCDTNMGVFGELKQPSVQPWLSLITAAMVVIDTNSHGCLRLQEVSKILHVQAFANMEC